MNFVTPIVINIIAIASNINKKNLILKTFLTPCKLKSKKLIRGIPNQYNHNTGYKGRTAIHEILEVNKPMTELIYNGANGNVIFDAAIKNGMTPLREAGIDKIIAEKTTIEEVARATIRD